jgi:hypothetical protein
MSRCDERFPSSQCGEHLSFVINVLRKNINHCLKSKHDFIHLIVTNISKRGTLMNISQCHDVMNFFEHRNVTKNIKYINVLNTLIH